MSEEKLLPCPFCGGDPILFKGKDYDSVLCPSCGAESKYCFECLYNNTRNEAIISWNKRDCKKGSPSYTQALRDAKKQMLSLFNKLILEDKK